VFQTPILFLIFNRPDTTKRVFESIKCIKPAKLYIAADGARKDKDGEDLLCSETRSIIDFVDWECEIKTLFRTENLGCKIAVSSSIDWFFENEEQGIILEDDCLPNQSFYNYCEDLLNRYKNDQRIMHISGCILDYNYNENYNSSYYFSKIASIWGWATWKRAWLKYDFEMKAFEEINKRKLKSYFKNDISLDFYYCFFEEYFSNKIDTWDIQWIFSIVNMIMIVIHFYEIFF
jgi:hypothetical protein